MVTVYQVGTADAALKQVEGYCRHLTDGGIFNEDTQPTRDWVRSQLDLDASYIAAQLEAAGYSHIQTDTEILQLLQLWNSLRTVIAIELTNPVEGISGQGNARFQEFKTQALAIEQLIGGVGIEDLGALTSGGSGDLLLATGISFSRKQAVEDDTDHIKHRFRRGQFSYLRRDIIADSDLVSPDGV